MSSHLDALTPILDGVVRPQAARLDSEGIFPSEAVAALGNAGLLGLVSATEFGGMGYGIRQSAEVIEAIAHCCGSTAMVVTMHYCGAAVIEQHGEESLRRRIASGQCLTTLAFSEAGSRSHFWAPLSTARPLDGGFELDAHKSWITSAHHADVYVWSSKPVEADGFCTLWSVPSDTPGLTVGDGFDGLGLRGNDSTPCKAASARVAATNRLGADGSGFDIMMGTVLPLFNVLSSACSLGLMDEATARTCEHAGGTRYQHLDSSLADLPTIRNTLARMRCKVDQCRAFLDATIDAIEKSKEDATIKVLESKAICNDGAAEVCDLAMRVCGGAAFRKDLAIERYFRDARAGMVMAPTSDVLYDFVGKAVCGMDLF